MIRTITACDRCAAEINDSVVRSLPGINVRVHVGPIDYVEVEAEHMCGPCRMELISALSPFVATVIPPPDVEIGEVPR